MQKRKGFTLIELIVVVIIIAILAAIAMTQYTRIVEKGRAAEAKTVLGSLRTLQIAYRLENATYGLVTDLTDDAITDCNSSHYFSYVCNNGADDGLCTASRCLAGGKEPDSAIAYDKTLDVDGTWGPVGSPY